VPRQLEGPPCTPIRPDSEDERGTFTVFFIGPDGRDRIGTYGLEAEAAAFVNYVNGGAGALPSSLVGRGGMLR